MAATFTSQSLCDLLGGTLEGLADVVITGVATLTDATEGDTVLVQSSRYAAGLAASRARVAVVSNGVKIPDEARHTATGQRTLVWVPDAEISSIALFGAFAPPKELPDVGCHPSAVIHPTATIDATARVGPLVSVGARTRIAGSTTIHAGAAVGADVQVGHGSTIGARAVLGDRVEIGNACVIGPGAVIGEEGFGYRPLGHRGLTRVPHIGTVILEDAVEIGANTTIDRAKSGATRIGQGTKIDNLCQIGHNVVIGKHCAISGLTGIAGSCTVGDGVVMGGAVGIADHLTIGAGAQIGAKSGLMRDVPPRARVAGLPAQDVRDTLRQVSLLKTLVDHAPQVQRLVRELGAAPAAQDAGHAEGS